MSEVNSPAKGKTPSRRKRLDSRPTEEHAGLRRWLALAGAEVERTALSIAVVVCSALLGVLLFFGLTTFSFIPIFFDIAQGISKLTHGNISQQLILWVLLIAGIFWFLAFVLTMGQSVSLDGIGAVGAFLLFLCLYKMLDSFWRAVQAIVAPIALLVGVIAAIALVVLIIIGLVQLWFKIAADVDLAGIAFAATFSFLAGFLLMGAARYSLGLDEEFAAELGDFVNGLIFQTVVLATLLLLGAFAVSARVWAPLGWLLVSGAMLYVFFAQPGSEAQRAAFDGFFGIDPGAVKKSIVWFVDVLMMLFNSCIVCALLLGLPAVISECMALTTKSKKKIA